MPRGLNKASEPAREADEHAMTPELVHRNIGAGPFDGIADEGCNSLVSQGSMQHRDLETVAPVDLFPSKEWIPGSMSLEIGTGTERCSQPALERS